MTDLADDVHANHVVDDSVKDRVKKVKSFLSFERAQSCNTGVQYIEKAVRQEYHQCDGIKSPFVEFVIGDKETLYIRKQTAVWLFQETECHQIDYLECVPRIRTVDLQILTFPVTSIHSLPEHAVGDLCAFHMTTQTQFIMQLAHIYVLLQTAALKILVLLEAQSGFSHLSFLVKNVQITYYLG